MIALTLLVFVLVALGISIVVAWLCTKLVKGALAKIAVSLFVVCVTPVSLAVQDTVGMRQFEEYCRAADQVQIHGTVAGADALYTSTGEWRLAHFSLATSDEHTKLVRYADSLVRWETGATATVPAVQPIWEQETKIFDARTNRLLAQWRSYSSRGGWARQTVLLGGLLECHPKLFREPGYQLYRAIFEKVPS